MPGWDQDRWVFVFDNSIESCISLSKASASRFSAVAILVVNQSQLQLDVWYHSGCLPCRSYVQEARLPHHMSTRS